MSSEADASLCTQPEIVAAERPSVAIVITTYNHAHYLGDAIASALAQTRPADEVIVVDDGSDDDPAAVVAAFAGVRLVAQGNQGLSAARNAGLAAARCEFVVFLDADDRLLPEAVQTGLQCHRQSAPCALVYGGHCSINGDGERFGPAMYTAIHNDPYGQLLAGNAIGMHATVMYRRHVLAQSGGFDVALRRCEDYDVYLRLAKSSRIASHPAIVAEYRKHGRNMSADHLEMLRHALRVQRRAAGVASTALVAAALREGRANWGAYYAEQILEAVAWRVRRDEIVQGHGARRAALMRAWQASPRYVGAWIARHAVRGTKRRLPPALRDCMRRLRQGMSRLDRVRFGDLAGTAPLDGNFGYGRGTPVDRFYIEAFLGTHCADIAGQALEIGDDSYSRCFGAERVTRQDVLHVHAGNARATIVGDLSTPGVLPPDGFDCIVLSQTLHLIFDMRAAVAELHRALRPGGVLLMTVPGISQIDRNDWGGTWYWALTPAAVSRLLAEAFGAGSLKVESHGSVFAATCFLQGIALHEVPPAKLLVHDPAYPVIVTARARKEPAGGGVRVGA